MCGRIALYTPPARIARYFQAKEAASLVDEAEPASWNVAPSRRVLTVAARHDRDPSRPDETGPLVRTLQPAQWGLVPFWAKDPSIGNRLVNARAEQLTEKPAFRRAFERRRCLVPADGFFEWQKLGRRRQPWYYRRADGAPLALAGLWETWRPPGDENRVLYTCTIVTTDAGPDVEKVHDRMPVVLEPGDFDEWVGLDDVDERALLSLLRPSPAGTLATYRVDPRMNTPEVDDASVIEPLGESDAGAAAPGGDGEQLEMFGTAH